MENKIKSQIIASEGQLRDAMLSSDVTVLERLLADTLVFTTHFGLLMSKKDDLDAHRSGQIEIKEIISSEQQLQLFENFVIVTVKNRIAGRFGDTFSEADFRFTRVWSRNATQQWQVVTGHACIAS